MSKKKMNVAQQWAHDLSDIEAVQGLFYSRITRVMETMCLRQWVIVVARKYLDHYFALDEENRTITAILELIPISCMIATKMYVDQPYTNKIWCTHFPPLGSTSESSLHIYNDRERQFLARLDFRLMLQNDVIENFFVEKK